MSKSGTDYRAIPPTPDSTRKQSRPFRPLPEFVKATDLTAEHPVSIWCYAGGRGANMSKANETIEDVAARVEWALVAKLTLQNPP
jgi:hypothetical protein